MTLDPLRVSGRRIVDPKNRTVTLRGMNFSGRHKQPPFLAAESTKDFLPLQRAGFDVIRLVLTWEAIEPEPGRYDENYLDRLEQLSTWAGEHALYVIMDMHQDIYSRTFGGSGAPEWTIHPEDLSERTETPDRNWFMRYAASPAVRRSLARFFTNADELQTKFIRAMQHAARRLAKHPEVIGFEPYNEPFGGELDLEKFEVDHLQPFYTRAIAAVREVAPNWIAFVEGALFASELGTHLELDRFENCVYFPHFYDKLVATSRVYSGDRGELERVTTTYERDAARMNVPWMLGEYGIPADAENAVAYLRDHEKALASYRTGGTCWQWNPTAVDWNDENMSVVGPGGSKTPLLAALTHIYPRALAAESYELVENNGVWTLSYDNRGTKTESQIYIPPKKSFDIEGGYVIASDDDVITVRANDGEHVSLSV